MITSLTPAQRLKLEIIERGINLSETARERLTDRGSRKLTEHDYATTSGLTLILPDGIHVNAPVGDWYCDRPAATFDWNHNDGYLLRSAAGIMKADPVNLPDYVSRPEGAPLGIMSHGDRIRISPITGCACACRFCDWHLKDYLPVPKEIQGEGLKIALADQSLPIRHILVSGGTPVPQDEDWLEEVYLETTKSSPLPVDVMLMPRRDVSMIRRLVDAGVHGFSVNIELFSNEGANRYCPEKHRVGRDAYAETIGRAVELTGGHGRVRSLLLIGLESPEDTLKGVEFVASLGADPVLSPFRPAFGTPCGNVRPPTADRMQGLYVAARDIAERHGVKLGPRCIPCMHNTITFPDSSNDYYYT